jgi:S1-C subfamily serine protease
MLTAAVKDRVINATVHVEKKSGQGVLVRGGYILTAAHCVNWDDRMALGGCYVEKVKTRDGRRLLAEVDAAEPVSDIASLAAPDEQEMSDECEEFERFAEEAEGLRLYTRPIDAGKRIRVYVLNRKREWITGMVVNCGKKGRPPAHRILLQADHPIRGGDSGGPIVDRSGRLVGLVSTIGTTKDHKGKYSGSQPVPAQALPTWLVNRIVGERPPALAAKGRRKRWE